jgi:hypothetical protein
VRCTVNLQTLIEFIKITIISLEQDLEGLAEQMDSLDMNSKDFADLDIEYNFISGQVTGMRYILSQAQGEE